MISTSIQANIVKTFGVIAAAAAAGTGVYSLINLLNTKLGIDFSKFRHKPSYKEHIAFLDEFSKEFEKIVRLLGQGKPLVVIIDDLDRCLPEKAMQVLEAIKIFLDVKGCVFILGLDRKLVEQAVAVKYKETTNANRDSKDSSKDEILQKKRRAFYEDYMDKIIQLSISLPRLSRSQIKVFVTNLSMDEDIKLCASIFGVGLSPNPRKIKRILRTFIFVRDMVSDDIIKGNIKGNIKLSILAKLIVIQSQLSEIFEAIAERSSLLEELENYYQTQVENQLQPNPTVEAKKEDPLLRDQAEKYAVDYPELRRILLEKINTADTFINADIEQYIALVGALAEVRPYSEEFRLTTLDSLDTKIDIVELDSSLLRFLAILPSSEDLEASTKRIVFALLRDATQLFAGKVHRTLLFLPDEKSGYLRVWEHFQMPMESVDRTRFYIGQEKTEKRGVAGEAFLEQKIVVGHMIQKDNNWISDNENFINFAKDRPFPPYRSFVAVPIIGSSNLGTGSLGVVCFDSPDPVVFDSPASQVLLRTISSRFAAVLLTYQQLLSPDKESMILRAGIKRPSEVERESMPWIAMEKYTRGEISLEELKEIERMWAQNSKEALHSSEKQNKN